MYVNSKNLAKLFTFFCSYFKLETKYFILTVKIFIISIVFSINKVNLNLGGCIDFSGIFYF